MKLLRTTINVLSIGLTLVAVVLLLGLTVAPTALGFKSYVVLSGSMQPAIPVGSVILARPVAPASLKVGDIIVYNRTDVNETVTHRIYQKNEDANGRPTFITKGDANGAPDSWTVQYSGDTAGKVQLWIPYVGYINHALASPQGRMVFLIVPVLVLSVMWLVQIWKPNKASEAEPARPAQPAPAPSVPAAPGPVDLKASASSAESRPLPLRR